MSSVFVSRLPVRVPASRRSRLLPWVLALIACAVILLLPEVAHAAEDLSDGGKVGEFLGKVKAALVPISVTVDTIAFVFAGYQIAFNHKRITDVAPVLVGAIVIGAAAQLAGWFIS